MSKSESKLQAATRKLMDAMAEIRVDPNTPCSTVRGDELVRRGRILARTVRREREQAGNPFLRLVQDKHLAAALMADIEAAIALSHARITLPGLTSEEDQG